MKESVFSSEIWLSKPPEEVFPFFGDAHNLEIITPPWLQFEVLTKGPIEMRPGILIDYRIRLHSIQLRWRTNIVAWETTLSIYRRPDQGSFSAVASRAHFRIAG
jgi:ligand-binding SRPBCC domain-containing protein